MLTSTYDTQTGLSSAREKRRRSKLQDQGRGHHRIILRSRSSSELPQKEEQDQPDYGAPPSVLIDQTNVSNMSIPTKGAHEEGEGESGKEEEEVISLLDCTLHLPESRDQHKQEWTPKEAFAAVPDGGRQLYSSSECPNLDNQSCTTNYNDISLQIHKLHSWQQLED